ncbi:MAG: Outer membrane protein-like protein [Bacteroidetes bacterium]|nr:MAG: Outer membrane protein-like protein [Bacteroidota bacterium]
MKIFLLSVGFTFFMFSSLLHAQSTDTLRLTMEQVFTRIDSVFPQLAVYAAKQDALQAQAGGAKSWMPPTLSAGLDRFPYRSSMLGETGPENQAGIMISLEQMIPNPAKLKAKQAAIESQYKIQSSNAGWTKNRLHADAKSYYYRRCVFEKKLSVIAENKSVLKLLIASAQERYKYNQADLAGIYKAEARLAALNNMELMIRAEIAACTIGLNTLMNRDPLAPLVLDTTISLKNYVHSPSNDSVICERSDLLAMHYSIQAMKAAQNQMTQERRPDFGAAITHAQMFGMENQYSIMGMLTIPIAPWSSGIYKSGVKAMSYEIDAMRKETETMQLMARQMATEKRVMLNYQQQVYANCRDRVVPAFQSNYDVSLLAYRQNTGSFFVLLDAWDMLLMTRLQMLDAFNSALQLQTGYEYETEAK